MGLTKVIDRSQTDKSDSYWPGFLSEIIASEQECQSQDLFYVDATIQPGVTTELHSHTTEIGFFVARGTLLLLLVSDDGTESEAYVSPKGTSGYISPGEGFLVVNIGDDEGELLMAHQGANSKETAKGQPLEVPDHARKLIVEQTAAE